MAATARWPHDVYASHRGFEMFTGKATVPGRNAQEMMIARCAHPHAAASGRPDMPQALEKALPSPLEAIRRRYATAVEFADALTAAAAGGGGRAGRIVRQAQGKFT